MIRWPLICASLLMASPLFASPPDGFSAPPPNLLYQLQKQNRSQPWLRVTLDTGRVDLKARRLDETGLAGLEPRRPGASLPDPIAWRSIARIDEVVTRSRSGGIAGFIVGGALGAGLGNAIGAGMRTNQTDPNGGTYTEGHGGMGAALGLAIVGGLGAWQGARFGDRFSRERPWYLGVPAPARAASDPVAAVAPEVPAPPAPAPRARINPAPDLSGAPGVLRACARIGRDDLLRMRGDFGQFQGYASVVGPQGMEGLRLDPGHADWSAAAPAGLVTWDRIDYVDKRGGNAGKGALLVGTAFGVTGGLLSFAIVSAFDGETRDALGALALGGATAGAFGAALGALVGAGIPGWHTVYHGP